MSTAVKQRDAASEAQFRAARPDASTWLAANAGSGKTKVLTDRVARLLLKGVQPQHILCLTYTKAAASEMQNRLFKRLGEWAMLEDGKLTAALIDLGEVQITGEDLAQARTLFARAIETPGGLKIQTIHSFCSSLLRRFPLEAGVSPQFSEMEDRAAALLRAEIVEDFAKGDHSHLVEPLARHVGGSDFEDLTAAICQRRAEFVTPLSYAELQERFDLPDGFDRQSLEQSVFLGGEAEVLAELRSLLQSGGTTDQRAAAKLASIDAPALADLAHLESIFLTGASAAAPFSAKIGKFPTKKLREANLALMDRVEPLMRRVEDARAKRLALTALRKSWELHQFAQAFLPEYERRKQLRGWLDFDDLILKARQLLNDPAVAAWVLYRLDGGIDHILVDEAQDTSPVQWDVIEKLAQEFTAGEGARSGVERTIFVVGDKKQSIYSFQGADPDAFDRMQREFGNRLAETGAGLQNAALEFSFRSSAAILRLVDLVFQGQDAAGFPRDALHRAFKVDLPGRVDLWPVVEKPDDDEEVDWTDPVDRPGKRHHTVILAERIAQQIKDMIDQKVTLPIDGPKGPDGQMTFERRPVHAGDFLILVQRRSELFSEIIRACKKADLPIAGADRLKVGAELAVKDIASLLSFLSTPEDSLALAEALKSPLFGWSEQMLFDLAHRRDGKQHLWEALRKRKSEFPQTMGILDDLRGQTDFLRPFDLIERILTRHKGRQKLLGRLGPEAEDGINALLSQALSYERSDIPSLTGFLVWMQTDDLEIKRQMGAAEGMVRVMSVHGSKGLEAPIVILPDTAKRNAPRDAEIMVAEGTPLWKLPKEQMPDLLLSARNTAQEKQQNERLRLLYVALTRAEKWLIVGAAGDLSKEGDTWYQRVEAALKSSGAVDHEHPGGTGLRLEHGDWDALPYVEKERSVSALPSLPDVFLQKAPDYLAPAPAVSPSDLGGAKALPGDRGLDEEEAKARGTRLHLLLEHLPLLPPEQWQERATALLSGVHDQKELLDEASAVLLARDLEHVFAPDSLAEVAITADLGQHKLYGIIDRLVITSDYVLAVDFKSNATTPKSAGDCPDGLLRQMGAYAHALGQIYPDKEIRTAIIWTRMAQLMMLPHEVVTDALFQSLEP
ncbi:ATP-dependent DNA helicase, UvrD/Rep family protein [Roseobacter sp. SK209-2-6]|uniref:double-strand break repair helicase AddA n=1 Tax=Roseobacter sp. SK209-2-6 TaxID=388739 RepID=UPI0000F3D0E4|nr:double-strand break repair helicase AddA [Roseobacter sp. SK209-2-6]EBA17032.1 ATP-dependent DNA helicase, UvrD/Rep family protein [Roseobacter sp. SK209-2-6]